MNECIEYIKKEWKIISMEMCTFTCIKASKKPSLKMHLLD